MPEVREKLIRNSEMAVCILLDLALLCVWGILELGAWFVCLFLEHCGLHTTLLQVAFYASSTFVLLWLLIWIVRDLSYELNGKVQHDATSKRRRTRPKKTVS